jgi:hypothetical protein
MKGTMFNIMSFSFEKAKLAKSSLPRKHSHGIQRYYYKSADTSIDIKFSSIETRVERYQIIRRTINYIEHRASTFTSIVWVVGTISL